MYILQGQLAFIKLPVDEFVMDYFMHDFSYLYRIRVI